MLLSSSFQLIGNTPLVRLTFPNQKNNQLYGKCEQYNLTGSMKDRIALAMILKAEQEKKLVPSGTIIEPTSGNTGIALAAIGKLKGYHVILTMPSSMSIERRKLLQIYGAKVVLTSPEKKMEGAILKAKELAKEIPNSVILQQFSNPENPLIHYFTTGKEILNDLKDIDILIAGIGTGGSISGIGKCLKEANHTIQIIGVSPKKEKHQIQGIGAGFIPQTFDENIVDEIIKISDKEAFFGCQEILKNDGLFVGISSGAVYAAAKKINEKVENKKIVLLFPDSGNRYLSCEGLYD